MKTMDLRVSECSECGHEHYVATLRRYCPCPVDECETCPFVDGDSDYDDVVAAYIRVQSTPLF